jgi:ABC-type transport system involved in multi-copper enzyme maturation permease subunit
MSESIFWEYHWKWPWRLLYPPDKAQINPMIKRLTELDWSFIIGIVMSFVAILFTFDSISGERERGTLALVMSNAVPKGVVLFGKFLGAFITLAIPMLLGMLLSLLIVNLSGSISLASGEWARIGFIVLISFFYVSIFIGLGLTISSRLGSNTSLLASLLIWVVLVVLAPNTLGAIVSTLRKAPSVSEVKRQKDAILEEIDEGFDSKGRFRFGSPSDKPPNEKALRHWADYITEKTEAESKFDDAHLARQFAQIDFARKILRISPAIIYNYALESLAGTGFERHRRFVAAVQRYRGQFVEFIKMADRGDSSSPHIYYIKEGLSQKPVDFAGVPRFEEGFTAEAAFRSSLIDLITLVLFAVFLFMLSYVAFLRCEVR